MKKATLLVSAMLLLAPTTALADSKHGYDFNMTSSSTTSQGSPTSNTTTSLPVHKGPVNLHGIQNALQHVKNPKAIQALQAILNGGSVTQAVQSLDSNSLNTSSSDPTAVTLITSLEQDQTESSSSKTAAFDKLSALLQQKGDVTNAIQATQDSVQLNPKDAKKLQQLGKLFQKRGDKDVKALVNGKQLTFDVKPVIKNGRTLVPVRAIAEALGAKVSWDPTTQTVTFTKGTNVVTLKIGSNTITVNGQTTTIDVPAGLINGRTVVPVKFISQALNATVQWVPDGQIVSIVTDTTSDSSNTTSTTDTTSTSSDPTTSTTDSTGTSTVDTSSTDTSTGTTNSTGTVVTNTSTDSSTSSTQPSGDSTSTSTGSTSTGTN